MSTASTIIANIRSLAQRNGEIDRRLYSELASVDATATAAKSAAQSAAGDTSDYSGTVSTLQSNVTAALNRVTTMEGIVSNLAQDATTSNKGLVQVGSNINVSSGTISVPDGSTSTKGVVQLSNATDSTSTTMAATAAAVKAAYDKASTAVSASVYVIRPTISINTAGNIFPNEGLYVESSLFDTSTGGDTHLNSSWKITSDVDGNTVVVSSLNDTTNKTSITFTSSQLNNLTSGNTYYIWCKHKGTEYGESGWSRSIKVKKLDTGTEVQEFKLWRGVNNISTIIEYHWPASSSGGLGSVRRMEVIDAKYRGLNLQFGTYGVDTANNNITGVSGTVAATATNTTVCGYVKSAYTEKTAKECCDIWMTYDGVTTSSGSTSTIGVPAVKFCRDITVDSENGQWDLPNIVQLAMIAAVRNTLNSMDPTANSYTNNKILTPSYTWSSSEYNTNFCWSINSSGGLSSSYKDNAYGVVPIREL